MPKPCEDVEITDVLGSAFVDYAAAVNFHRSIPDCRDGLKPVQRCILYAMHRMGLVGTSNRTMTKVQAVAAEVSGKYHPHGDAAAADALYKLGQSWVMRYPLVIAEGNFGSPDEEPSAPRYPETALSAVGRFLIGDELNPDVIEHRPNYDDKHVIPMYMPSPFPNLLCNGQQGIGSAMAFQSISHNLAEVVAVIKTVARHPNTTIDRILSLMPGPDLPTGGIVFRHTPSGGDGIRDYYETGRGTVVIRGRMHRVGDGRSGPVRLIITEVPYGVGREQLVGDIASRQDEFEEIVQVTNLSSDVTRIEIELRRDADVDAVIQRLYDRTRLQVNFSVNNTFVEVDVDEPTIRTMSIRDMVDAHVRHRDATILRRAQVGARAATARIEVLEGFLRALAAIRKVVDIVTTAPDADSALRGLMDRIKLTEVQARAILAMQLQAFTRMAAGRVEDDLSRMRSELSGFETLISDGSARIHEMCRELDAIVSKVGDERRTTIVASSPDMATAEQVAVDDRAMLILSDVRTIRRCATYEASHNPATGGYTLRRDLAIHTESVILVTPGDRVAIVDDAGRLYSFDATEVPFSPIDETGTQLTDVCGIPSDRRAVGLMTLPIANPETNFLLTVSDHGFLKRTPVQEFMNRRPSGMRAVAPADGERIVHASIVDGGVSIILASSGNRLCRFPIDRVNPQGVTARGMRGIRLEDGETLCGCGVIPTGSGAIDVVVATARGRFRRCDASSIRGTSRDTRGFRALSAIADDDRLVGIAVVRQDQAVRYTTVLGRSGIVDPRAIPRSPEADRGRDVVSVKANNPIVRMEAFDADAN